MEEWEIIAILVVMLSVSISAIMLMVSRLLALPTLEQWAKTEMIFSLSTVFLVIFLAVFLEGIQPLLVDAVQYMTEHNFGMQTGFVPDLPSGQEADLMDYALAYMQSVFSCIENMFKFLLKLNFPLELAASYQVDVFMFDLVTGWAFKGPVQTIHILSNYITFTLFIYYLFVHIMRFTQATAIAVFVPLGIILRQFPPTRGAGAFVLAFSLGFYIVFPLAYIMVANVAPQTFVCPMLPEFDGLDDLNTYGIINPDKAYDVMMWTESHQSSIMSALSGMSGQIGGFDMDPFGVVPDALEVAGGQAAGFSINLCCLPFLALMITMSFVLSSTNLFGANLPEIGRGFVKLI